MLSTRTARPAHMTELTRVGLTCRAFARAGSKGGSHDRAHTGAGSHAGHSPWLAQMISNILEWLTSICWESILYNLLFCNILRWIRNAEYMFPMRKACVEMEGLACMWEMTFSFPWALSLRKPSTGTQTFVGCRAPPHPRDLPACLLLPPSYYLLLEPTGQVSETLHTSPIGFYRIWSTPGCLWLGRNLIPQGTVVL